MEDLIISKRVRAQVATALNMTEAQLQSWFESNVDTVKLIRDYVEDNGVATPADIEANADPAGPLDPILTENILRLFELADQWIRVRRATP